MTCANEEFLSDAPSKSWDWQRLCATAVFAFRLNVVQTLYK